ncbi:MAG: hypothetical protein ACRDAM_07545, partial [Casimicrobium sp.]
MRNAFVKRCLIAIVTTLWFVTGTLAQTHMTAMLASHASMSDHPAMPLASEQNAQINWAMQENYVIIDSAVFWDAVDNYSGDNHCGSACVLTMSAMPLTAIAATFPAPSTTALR